MFMDKIIITNLRAMGILGIKQAERENPQELLINCTLFKDIRKAAMTDSILETINYSTVAKHILAMVANSQFYTVEALCETLCTQLLKYFRPGAVRLRVEKTQVVKAADRVGVEIFRWFH